MNVALVIVAELIAFIMRAPNIVRKRTAVGHHQCLTQTLVFSFVDDDFGQHII